MPAETGGRTCAYCGATRGLTREHLWPTALHRRVVGGKRELTRIWQAKLKKEIAAEPTIRDVCSECNNGDLSKLDAYICELFDRFFVNLLERYDEVVFEYYYHRLKRCLLKLCYNSAPTEAAKDTFVFKPLLPYIMGTSPNVGRSVQLYVQLSYPDEVPTHLLGSDDPKPFIYYPALNRIGHYSFNVQAGRKMLRAVHLQSFSFYLAFFEPGETRKEMDFFQNAFLDQTPATELLRASRDRVTLVCNGVSAWHSIANSRGEFVWS